MPSRWFVPISGLDPARVQLGHIHAAFSRLFDAPEDGSPTAGMVDHEAAEKPYSISPLTRRDDLVGVEIATLTPQADALFRSAFTPGAEVRLGNQVRKLGRPRGVESRTFEQLAAGPYGARWELTFLTPVTFRSGDRSSPLPNIPAMLGALGRAWTTWSETPSRLTREDHPAVWVSDLDIASELLTLAIGRGQLRVSAATGTIVVRCDTGVEERVAPLLRLAPYTGVGSYTKRGLGVVQVREISSRKT